jgi:chitinase
MILTVPVGWVGGSTAQDAFYGQISSLVDRIFIMSYIMAGPWGGWMSWHSSALYGETSNTPTSVSAGVKAYMGAGVPAAKLGVGAGFFGQCWRGTVTAPRQSLGSSTIVADDGAMSYANIMTSYYTSAAYKYDTVAKAPYLSYATAYGPQKCNYISYEDPTSLIEKARYVKANGLGGVIVWTINQGYFSSATDKNPLLTALSQGMAFTD